MPTCVLLTKHQQDRLRNVAKKGAVAIDNEVAKLKLENPRAFLRPEDLPNRRFLNQPISLYTPYLSYERAYDKKIF